MRVLWLTPKKPENISVGRERIATHLRNNGYEVNVCPGRLETLLSVILSKDSYDAIVGTTRAGAIVGSLLKLLTQTPLLIDHIDPISQFAQTRSGLLAGCVKIIEQLTFYIADHTLYVYPEEGSRVKKYSRASTKTNLGVDFERFADPDNQILTDAQEHIESLNLESNVAIYVGGLEPIYHIEAMIDSISYLENWSLLLLGSGSLEPTVKEAAVSSDQIVFPGTVPHESIPGYLHAADVGISLVDDPYTLKVLEYGAAGLPTVQIEGRAEERFGDSVVYCSAEPESIARSVRAAKGHETKALREIAQKYSWSAIAETYATNLETIL